MFLSRQEAEISQTHSVWHDIKTLIFGDVELPISSSGLERSDHMFWSLEVSSWRTQIEISQYLHWVWWRTGGIGAPDGEITLLLRKLAAC